MCPEPVTLYQAVRPWVRSLTMRPALAALALAACSTTPMPATGRRDRRSTVADASPKTSACTALSEPGRYIVTSPRPAP